MGFPKLRSLVPQMAHLEHLIFDVLNCSGPQASLKKKLKHIIFGLYKYAGPQVSLAKEDARAMTSLVPACTPRLRKVTFDGCQPVLLDAVRERLADAFATSSSTPTPIRVEEVVITTETKLNLAIATSDIQGVVPLCQLLAEHSSPVQRLVFKCKISDSMEPSAAELFERVAKLGIPEVQW